MTTSRELIKHGQEVAKKDGFTLKNLGGGEWVVIDRKTKQQLGHTDSFILIYESLMAGFYDKYRKPIEK